MSSPKSVSEDENTEHWLTNMAQQLSGVTVVIIIAGGVLTFLLLFIFAKRQIMRFTLRSHRGPHAPCGLDASKTLRREILRRIDALQKITYEPQVLSDVASSQFVQEGATRPCHYHRMKAMDDAKHLELSMVKKKLGKRQSFESLRSYLIVTLTPQVDPRVVHQFCDLYEAARFNPKPFNEEEYKSYYQLLKQLKNAVCVVQPRSSVKSPSKGSSTAAKSVVPPNLSTLSMSQPVEEKSAFEALAAPYIRKLTKKDKSKWTQSRSTEEEQALCDSAALHEISIISSKDESTAV